MKRVAVDAIFKEAAAKNLGNALFQPKALLRWLNDRVAELEAGKDPDKVMDDVLRDLDMARDALDEVAEKIDRKLRSGVYGGTETSEGDKP